MAPEGLAVLIVEVLARTDGDTLTIALDVILGFVLTAFGLGFRVKPT
ncbi:MAG: hypothetical protein P8Y25_14400 [Chromatiaceae bacterium]